MFPLATRSAAERLVASLMSLVRAAAHIAINGSTPTLDDSAAQTLFCRLSALVTRLIRLDMFGPRAPTNPRTPTANPTTKANPSSPAAPSEPLPAPAASAAAVASLPRRPGWLLEALPDTAPAIAADLALLLADPALAPLLTADPTLHRPLRSLLRSLGLPGLADPPPPAAPPPAPGPEPKPRPTAASPATPAPAAPTAPRETGHPASALSHVQTVP